MKAWHLTGSKREIAERVSKIEGEVHEAIVFVDEPIDPNRPVAANGTVADIFAEMEPFTVRRGDVDASRDAIYRKAEGE